MSLRSVSLGTINIHKVIVAAFWGLLGSLMLYSFWLSTKFTLEASGFLALELIKMLSAIVLGVGMAYDSYSRYKKNGLSANNQFRLLAGVIILVVLLMLAGQSLISFEYVFIALLILGASYLDGTKLIRTYAYICTGLLCFTMLSCQLGLIPNLVYAVDGVSRVSFGIIYPTDFCARIFFIAMAFIFAKGNKVDIKDIVSLMLFGIFCICFCRGRNTAICFFMAAFLFGVYWAVNKYKAGVLDSKPVKGLGWIAIFAAPVLSLVMIILSSTYDCFALDSFMYKVNHKLSGRLLIGKRAFNDLAITPFGQPVQEAGNGAMVAEELRPIYVHPELVKGTVAVAVVLLFAMLAFFLIKKIRMPVLIGSAVVMTALCFVGKALLATYNTSDKGPLTYDERILEIQKTLTGQYFFLDCSYISLLFKAGWVILAAVILVYVLTSYKQLTSREWIRLLVLVVVAVQCTLEHHLIDLSYCPFLLMLLAKKDEPKSEPVPAQTAASKVGE